MGKRDPHRDAEQKRGLSGAPPPTEPQGGAGTPAGSPSKEDVSGGRVSHLLEQLDSSQRGMLRETEPPRRPRPMLAKLSAQTFSDPGWVFERKLDGERVFTLGGTSGPRLLSRNGREISSSYPEVVDALRYAFAEDSRVTLDGEVVAFSGPVTSFTRLQGRLRSNDADEGRKPRVDVYYYVFDLLHLGRHDLSRLPLLTRKRLLAGLMSFEDPIRFLPHREQEGEAFHRQACERGWEGIMAKRADSGYRPGRSRSWLKLKCVNRQELVIGGFTEPEGSRKGFGALMVGYYEEDGEELRYAGKVGTGFDAATLDHMTHLLLAREQTTPPFSAKDRPSLPGEGVHWVTPELVGQFGFTEWTTAGKLRHPRFMGLRRDKDPVEVIREEPVHAVDLLGGAP